MCSPSRRRSLWLTWSTYWKNYRHSLRSLILPISNQWPFFWPTTVSDDPPPTQFTSAAATPELISAPYCQVTASAVRILEILNRIEQLLLIAKQYSVWNEHNYSKFSNTYRHRFLTYLTEWRRFFTLAATTSNQQNLWLTMVQVLYLLYLCLYIGALWPSKCWTPTTTIVWCHKNSSIYLTSTYYWWLLRPMITIWFHSEFQIIAQLFDSIRFEMKNKKLSYCWETVQRESMPRIAEMDVEMTT